jgi:multidrug resistance protein, MATE family
MQHQVEAPVAHDTDVARVRTPRRVHVRETLTLAIPVAIGQLGHVMLGVVDSAMVGRVGTVPLAAAALVHGLYFLLFVTGIGVSLAITPLVAMAQGGGRTGESWQVLRHGLVMNLAFAVMCVGGGYLIAESIPLLGQPADVTAEAVAYMHVMLWCYPLMMAYHAYRQFIEGLGETRPAMIIAICANGVNALLNWIFIFGHFGMPALGLVGAGLSTVVTEVAMLVALVTYVYRSPRYRAERLAAHGGADALVRHDGAASHRRFNPALLRRLISIGIPSGLQYLFEVSAFSLSAIMVGWAGSVSLAAHQVALSLASVTYMIILGITAAATIRVANAAGRGARADLRRAGFTAIAMGAGVMSLFGIAFAIFRNELPRFYVADPAVIEMASSLLVIAAIFQIMDGTQAVSMGALRGITDVKAPSVIAFLAYWVVSLPIGYLLGIHWHWGAIGIWTGFVFGLAVASSLFLTRFALKTTVR